MPKPLVATANQLRHTLAGPSMRRFIAAMGATSAQQDEALEGLIRNAQSYFETEGEIHFFQTRIAPRPAPLTWTRRTADAANDYDKIEDALTYFSDDWTRGPVTIKLRKGPALSVQGVSLQWGNQNAGKLRIFPSAWLIPDARGRTVNITAIPGIGGASYDGERLFLPIALGLMQTNAVPTLLHVAYTAGYLPYEFDAENDDLDDACPDFEEIRLLVEGVKAHAGLQMLKHTRNSFGAGGGSVAIDGLSQSGSAGRFAQEIKDLADDVDEALKIARKHIGGIQIMVG